MSFFKKFLKPICILLVLIIYSLPCLADEITDSINEGLEYYKSGDFTSSVSSLRYATQLIQQKKGESLETILPEALPGWTSNPATSNAAAGEFFGGGLSAEKSYNKENSSISIQILADSPMMQGVMMMISNPMLVSSDGGKLKKIKNQKAVVRYNEMNKGGEIQIVVVNRFLVTISGNSVTEDELVEYAMAVNYLKLSRLP
ncbi:MAG: hypothetical protein RBR08_14700 [Desulforegulaceae bacterium]|nr:hypothetical protein [Desulforegulaceae bacterium]